MARDTKKKQPIKEGIAVIADGETEQWYLQLLFSYHNVRVSLKPELECKTIKAQYELLSELVKKYDKVLWIIDLDVTLKDNKGSKNPGQALNQFKTYYEKATKSKWSDRVSIIINNPCLEYWYLLHNNDKTTKYYPNYGNMKPELRKFVVDKRLFEHYDKSEKDDYRAGKGIYKKLLPYLLKMDFSKLKAFNVEKCEEESCSEMYKLFSFLGIDLGKEKR